MTYKEQTQKLRDQIESVRLELGSLIDQLGFQALEVIVKSEELDKLLNEYMRLTDPNWSAQKSSQKVVCG